MNFRTSMRGIVLSASILLPPGCAERLEIPIEEPATITEAPSPFIAYHPERAVYFGDLHVHTKYSFDAFVFGSRATPDDVYRFAQGEALTHPDGFELKLQRPLDFQAVTDHAIYLGMLPAMADESSRVARHPLAIAMREAETADERGQAFLALVARFRNRDQDDLLDDSIVRSAWQDTIEAADRHNLPGTFTTFIGYEFSASRNGDSLHRNVIFRGARAPQRPFSARDAASNPQKLWNWMDGLRADGIESLAIPHNSNLSNGQMFDMVSWDGSALSEAEAAQRRRNEPLVEITQAKGSSETHPALSPNDEWAEFEIDPFRIRKNELANPSGSYARDALLKGLLFEERGRSNPFELGFVGSTDTHVGAGSYDESNYWGKLGNLDGSPVLRGSIPSGIEADGGTQYVETNYQRWGASGLAGVWAESNTRAALFDALRRRETFGTSGPRIRLRFFASHAFAEDLLNRPQLLKQAYAQGVPMGSSLALRGNHSPLFLAWAMRDPDSAPLQRLQMVKGWTDESGMQERVYDIACSDGAAPDPKNHRCPDNGARVDTNNCSISSDVGDSELKVVWRDPDYKAGERAIYYLRALENPTCRWSTWDAVREGVPPRVGVPLTLQERAWSSPIWIRP